MRGSACAATAPGFRPSTYSRPLRYQGRDVRVGIIRDLTQRTLAEAEQRELLATIDLGAFLTRDPNGTIRHWSAGCERLYGWTAAEAVGRHSHELLQTRFPVPLAVIEATLEQDGKWVGDLEHRTRSGARLVAIARKELRRHEGGRVQVLESLTDVTAQRAAEDGVRRNEAQLQRIVEHAPIPMMVHDEDGRVLHLSQRWSQLTGYTLADIPTTAAWAERAFGAEAGRAAAAGAPAGATPAEGGGECLVRTASGEMRCWLFRAATTGSDAQGRQVLVSMAMDVTETRATEAALRDSEASLRQLNEALEEQVQAEVAAREAAQVRAAHAERMQALGQLAGGIAHDFNNVLQAVQGGAGLIEETPNNPVSVRRRASMVVHAAERGAAITRRLLTFSRRGDLRTETVPTAPLLHGMLEMLRHTLGAAIEVRVEAAAELPPLLADRSQLETVLVNLATNARDAMPDGGVLTFTAAPEIRSGNVAAAPSGPDALPEGRYVRLTVTDTGSGIPGEVLARVAEPFFTTKGQGKGTGLGLAMAKGFSEQSGGALNIESAPGRGTTVSLWFPAGANETGNDAAEATTERRDTVGPRVRVLLVDDDEIVREILAEQLESSNLLVLPVESGAAAISLLDAGERVDVLVSDFSMPGMDGLSVISEAKRRRPGLPAVLLTGYATKAAELAADGETSGAFTLLRKPVTAAQLAERINLLAAAPAS